MRDDGATKAPQEMTRKRPRTRTRTTVFNPFIFYLYVGYERRRGFCCTITDMIRCEAVGI